jgi:heme-degrading monooxygenase HmoA
MFVALSRFTIANDMLEEVRMAFCQRPHLVDEAMGFLGMERLCARLKPKPRFGL